jgi:hypothetical protein
MQLEDCNMRHVTCLCYSSRHVYVTAVDMFMLQQ